MHRMESTQFSHAIEVRYGDLDPQGHVNNANFLTYLEQTRIHYLVELGLFKKGESFLEVGIIVAEAQITFLSPILFGMKVVVEARVTRLGNKSMDMVYGMVDSETGAQLARASTTLVTYDYHSNKTILIPDGWRSRISEFEKV